MTDKLCNKILIIKSSNNVFERYICKMLKNHHVDVVSVGKIYCNEQGLKKRKNIVRFCNNAKLLQYEKIIVFDEIILYLYLSLKNKRAFLWLWNIYKEDRLNNIRLWLCKRNGKVYSFDDYDVEKYGLKKTRSFMIIPIIEMLRMVLNIVLIL